MTHKLNFLTITISLGFLLIGCGGGMEEALQADNAEESANDLIKFFEKADQKLKQLAKTASDAID